MKKGKVTVYFSLVSITLFLLFSGILILNTHVAPYVESATGDRTDPLFNNFMVQLAYTEHTPIVITSNADFVTLGFSGDGSLNTPYLIENYNITTPFDCITISDTTAHFILQNCLLTGGAGGAGILMTNVVNGVILNNTITEKVSPIRIVSSSGNVIANNTISDMTSHLFIEFSSNNMLLNNTISGTLYHAVYLRASSNITLVNNTIIGNNYIQSIYLVNSPDNTFSGNILTNNGFGLRGLSHLENWRQNITDDNLVNGKPVGYFWNRTGETIDGSQYSQLILGNCSEITMENTFYNDTFWGISLGYSSHCLMRNITFSENTKASIMFEVSVDNTIMNCKLSGDSGVGLFLATSSDNTFVNNSILGYTIGVLIEFSTNNTLTNNTISENQEYGLETFDSPYTTLTNNTISENGSGIHLNNPGDSYNELVRNTISNNDHRGITINYGRDTVINNTISGNEEGIRFLDYASYTTVVNNTISASEYGIRFYSNSNNNMIVNNTISGSSLYGVYFDSATFANLIYLNYFTDNSGQEAQDDGAGNYWNTTGIGNYWSDYSGTGPYYIPGTAGSIDYHPYGYTESVLPEINHPNDIEYDEGTVGHNITWSPSDVHASHYVLYRNSVRVGVGDWDGGNITIDIDGLDPGTYNYSILVYDFYTNWVSDNVIVTVIAGVVTTTNTTGGISENLGLVQILAVGGVVGVVLVVVILMRKRS